MKIVTYLLGALLAAALAGAALFYFTTFQPMFADYTRMKAGMPELDRAKAELKKYKEKESKEAGWIKPALELLNSGLSDEIKSGKAEVAAAGTDVVVNISEELLYTPRSMTFAKDSPQLRSKLAALLASNELKGKEILVGNTTDAVPAQGKGAKKIPPKDARTLAADRSVALARFFEQNKVEPNTLVSAAYNAKLPETGFKIKDHKTFIVIKNPPAPSGAPVTPQPKPAAAAPPEKTPAQPAPAQPAPKTIPIKPAEPKGR